MTSRIQRMCSAGASRPPPPRSSSSRIKTINATTLDLPPFEPTLSGPAGIKRLFEKRPPPGGLPVPGPCAAGLAALHERAPATGFDVHAEPARGCADATPGGLALLVGDAFYLVEAGDRVAHVPRVVQRLLALLRKRKVLRDMRFFCRVLSPCDLFGMRWPPARRLCTLRAFLMLRRAAAFWRAVAMSDLLRSEIPP